MTKILIIGGGFAGVWSAAGAIRLRNECGAQPSDMNVTLVSMSDDMVIRPRLYEAAPHKMRVALDDVLKPIGVTRLKATVIGIDTQARTVTAVIDGGEPQRLSYDRLVLAAGSQVVRPKLPGASHLFDVDTIEGASRLEAHLKSLPGDGTDPGRFTVLVAGAGFTGIEVATEIGARLRDIAPDATIRVVMVERESEVGPELGANPRPIIAAALDSLGVETMVGVGLVGATQDSAKLSDGSTIATRTIIWTAGMRASPLTELVDAPRDAIGRLKVDPYLRVEGVEHVYAAGDTAAAPAEDGHVVMQSCQHALPQGKFAGHNVAADVLGQPLVRFKPVPYVTCLDLGPAGAVASSGFDRQVTMHGAACKDLKRTINAKWIYPPVNDAKALLDAAGPQPDWPEYVPPNAQALAFGRS